VALLIALKNQQKPLSKSEIQAIISGQMRANFVNIQSDVKKSIMLTPDVVLKALHRTYLTSMTKNSHTRILTTELEDPEVTKFMQKMQTFFDTLEQLSPTSDNILVRWYKADQKRNVHHSSRDAKQLQIDYIVEEWALLASREYLKIKQEEVPTAVYKTVIRMLLNELYIYAQYGDFVEEPPLI
jgi:hypothetical protein